MFSLSARSIRTLSAGSRLALITAVPVVMFAMLLPLAGVAQAANGAVVWTKLLGTSASDVAISAAVDAAGNTYVVGATSGAIGSTPNAGMFDAFLAKLSPAGALIWTRQFGTSAEDAANGVGLDDSGHVLVGGTTGGALGGTFRGGALDVFLAQYDTDGNRQWIIQQGSAGSDTASSIAVDGSGNTYLVGSSSGGIGGTPEFGGFDAFVSKFGPSGGWNWTRKIATGSGDYGQGIAVNRQNGAIIVTGGTSGALVGTNAGDSDVFVAAFGSAGGRLWLRQFGSHQQDLGTAVAIDDSGNAFVTGYTSGNLDGNTNSCPCTSPTADIFLTKYDSNGVKLWTRELGTTDRFRNANDRGYAVATDSGGSAYIAGGTQGGLDGNPNFGPFYDDDTFLTKYDANGVKQWTRQRGTSQQDIALGVARGPNDVMIVVGTTDGNLGGNINAGLDDVFISKYI